MAKRRQEDEVIAGGRDDSRYRGGNNGQRDPVGLARYEHWEEPFSDMPWYNKVKEVMEIPPTSDMAGVFERTVFKNDRERTAAVRLYYRNKKFNDADHQEMLRVELASRIAMHGRGRVDIIHAATNLIAPDIYRAVMGLPKNKDGQEKVHRGSDFRERRDDNRDNGG